MNYLASLIMHLFAGLIFAAVFGTFMIGPAYLFCILAGFTLQLKLVYAPIYVFFFLFGKTTINGRNFSTFRGWHH